MSIKANAEYLRTLGGPGSGWTAENGHVPGSSGGSKKELERVSKKADSISRLANGHDDKELHLNAAFAHGEASNKHDSAARQSDTTKLRDYHNQMASYHRGKSEEHIQHIGSSKRQQAFRQIFT